MKKRIKRIKGKTIIITLLSITLIVVLILLLYVPRISLKGEKILTIKLGDEYKEPGYYSHFINFDLSSKVKVDGNVDSNKIGKYKIEYTATNLLGVFDTKETRFVNVIDDVKPEIELVDDTVLLKVGDEYKEPGYKAVDNYDGNITDKVVIKNEVDNKILGEYEVTYTVSDSSLNTSIVKRKVVVYDYNVKSIPIFTYHNFMTQEEKNTYAPYDKYTMSVESFEKQLKYLSENGYNSITLEEFYLWYIGQKKLSDKDVVIVIDDGNVSSYFYAIPLLEKYNFNATIFVVTGRIKDSEISWDPSKHQFLNFSIINEIEEKHKKIHLASHTHNLHSKINGSCSLASKTFDELYNDFVTSKEYIDSNYLAYPFGCYNADSFSALKKSNYKMAFTFGENKRATKDDNIYAIKRININANTTMKEFINWLEE